MEKKTRKKSLTLKLITIFAILGFVAMLLIFMAVVMYRLYENGGFPEQTPFIESLEKAKNNKIYYKFTTENNEYVIDKEGDYVENVNSYINIIGFSTTKEQITKHKKIADIDIDKISDIKTLTRFFYNREEEFSIDISKSDENIVIFDNKTYHFPKNYKLQFAMVSYINSMIEERELEGDIYFFEDDFKFIEKVK